MNQYQHLNFFFLSYTKQQKQDNSTLGATNNIPITFPKDGSASVSPSSLPPPLHSFRQPHLEYFIFVRLKRVEFQLEIAQVPQGNCLQGGWKRVTEALTTTLNTCKSY